MPEVVVISCSWEPLIRVKTTFVIEGSAFLNWLFASRLGWPAASKVSFSALVGGPFNKPGECSYF